MTTGTIIDALDRSAELLNEVITDPHQIAELGSVKPKEYGSLMRNKLAGLGITNKTESLFSEQLFSENADDVHNDISGQSDEGIQLDYSPEELAQETADCLLDAGITAESWNSATLEEREKLLESTVAIMEKEMHILPEQVDVAALDTDTFSEYEVFRIGSGRNGMFHTEQSLLKAEFGVTAVRLFFLLSRIRYCVQRSRFAAFNTAEMERTTNNRLATYDSQAYLDTAYFKKSLKDSEAR